jgi:hypothetical protein
MKGKGQASSADDCFAQFDAAFARLEGELSERQPVARTSNADLSEYEEAFTNIDRQLDAQVTPGPAPASPPMPVQQDPPPTASSRPGLALVATPPQPAAEPPRAAADAPADGEEFWRLTAGGGTALERLVVTVQNLLWLHRAAQTGGSRAGDRMSWQGVADVLAETQRVCDEFDLPTARVRVEFARASLEEGRRHRLGIEIGELVRHMRHDLQSCAMTPIPQSRAWMFTAELDPRGAAAFPAAVAEIAAGGRCIGHGLHSAAVFHILRAATVGQRHLALALQANSFEPAADWAATIAQLESRLAEAMRWNGAAKVQAMGFYHALLNDARLLQDADRNVHAGDRFDEHHAIAVLYAARHFLNRLAEHVSDTQDRPLTQADFG